MNANINNRGGHIHTSTNTQLCCCRRHFVSFGTPVGCVGHTLAQVLFCYFWHLPLQLPLLDCVFSPFFCLCPFPSTDSTVWSPLRKRGHATLGEKKHAKSHGVSCNIAIPFLAVFVQIRVYPNSWSSLSKDYQAVNSCGFSVVKNTELEQKQISPSEIEAKRFTGFTSVGYSTQWSRKLPRGNGPGHVRTMKSVSTSS